MLLTATRSSISFHDFANEMFFQNAKLYICNYIYVLINFVYCYFQEDKSGSAGMSAYERLFGSSRETSLSPPESPGKRMIRGSSGESSLSPIMSPVFKSDAAKAIMQEVGVVSGQKRVHRRIKKRSLTITGSTHPAVMEALQGHNARVSIR